MKKKLAVNFQSIFVMNTFFLFHIPIHVILIIPILPTCILIPEETKKHTLDTVKIKLVIITFWHSMNFLIKLVFFNWIDLCFACSGENVEDAFLETAKKIYQNIQDGRYA